MKSLLSEQSLQLIIAETPRTYTGFAPLGLVLTIMLGAGVADGSGLFAALMRGALSGVPERALVPATMLMGMLTCHASDAGFVVFVPLAGLAFAAAGRHPVLGITVGFAGVCVGLAGNLLPGMYDVLILGITETGARLIEPGWTMNPLGNWWFSIGIAVVFTALGWFVTERIVAPRLGPWHGDGSDVSERRAAQLTTMERRGLGAAGLAALGVVAAFAMLALWPGFTPLYDEAAAPGQRLTPLFRGLTPGFLLLFLATGWAYGASTGTVRSHRDIVAMMEKGLVGMLPYLVLVFFAAQFVAMFGWSNLGPITAIVGADQLRAIHAPPALLLPMFDDDVGLARLSDRFRFGEVDGDGASGCTDDDAAGHLPGNDHGGLSGRRHRHQPDLAAESLFRADVGLMPALDSGLPPGLIARAGAPSEYRVLPGRRRLDRDLGGARTPGRTRRRSVLRSVGSGTLNGSAGRRLLSSGVVADR